VSIDTLLAWGTSRFDSVSVKHDVRKDGISNYTFMKLVTHAFNMMTGFTVLPLQIASLCGIHVYAVWCWRPGLRAGPVLPARHYRGGLSFPGFRDCDFFRRPVVRAGVIGEYLSRMHFRLMDRPPYAIREATTEDLASEQHDPKAL